MKDRNYNKENNKKQFYIPFDNSYCINCKTNKQAYIVQSSIIITPKEEGAAFEIVSEPYEEIVNFLGISNKYTFIEVKSSKTGNIYRTLYNKKFLLLTKFYCVYLAYAKWEVMDRNNEDYNNLPDYPKDFARVRIYDNQLSQLECYANTPCPASQIFEADTIEEINKKVEELKNNFVNEAWLDKNIRPFL